MNPDHTDDLPIIDREIPLCRHLRSKGMYVFTDGPDADTTKDYDDTAYWCLRTMKEFGPDEEMVGAALCRTTARPCYEPL
jgi:hypothetical protein